MNKNRAQCSSFEIWPKSCAEENLLTLMDVFKNRRVIGINELGVQLKKLFKKSKERIKN